MSRALLRHREVERNAVCGFFSAGKDCVASVGVDRNTAIMGSPDDGCIDNF